MEGLTGLAEGLTGLTEGLTGLVEGLAGVAEGLAGLIPRCLGLGRLREGFMSSVVVFPLLVLEWSLLRG